MHQIDSDEVSVEVVKNAPYRVRNVALDAPFNRLWGKRDRIYPVPQWSFQEQTLLRRVTS